LYIKFFYCNLLKIVIIIIKYLLNYLHESNYEQNSVSNMLLLEILLIFNFLFLQFFTCYHGKNPFSVSAPLITICCIFSHFNVLLYLINFKYNSYFVRNYSMQHCLKEYPKNVYIIIASRWLQDAARRIVFYGTF